MDGLESEIAFGAGHSESALAEGSKRFASGDEDHFLAGLGEASAEVGADGAGPEDADSHQSLVGSRRANVVSSSELRCWLRLAAPNSLNLPQLLDSVARSR